MPSQSRQPQTTPAVSSAVDAQECLTDFGSNEERGARVQGPDLADRGASVRTAVEDVGDVNGLDTRFSARAGAVLDAMLPNVGDKGKLQLNVNVPVDQTGTVKVGFEFVVEGERDEKGVKGRIQIGGAVTGSQEVDGYIATVAVFAQAKVFGYMECYGDASAEMFDLMILGLRTRVAYVSPRLAASVFDGKQQAATVHEMDGDDYSESGLGASFDVGVSVEADGDKAGGSAGVAGQVGTRLISDGRGGLASKGVKQLQTTLSGSVEPFALGGQLTGKWEVDQLASIEAQLSGEAMVGADQLSELTVGGRWLSGVIGQLGGIVRRGSGLLADEGASRRAAGLATFIQQSSGTGALAEAASARALSELRAMGVKLGHKLTLTGTWSPSGGYGLELRLERVSQVEYGDSPRDVVYLLVEQVQRVFSIKVGG